MKTSLSKSREDLITPDLLKARLKASIFSRNIVLLQRTDSTNTRVKELAVLGAPEGTLVVAEEQTAGRGRLGRSWLSPPGANLLCSLLLRPPFEADQAFCLTMTLALSAIEALEEREGLIATIKWPNDLYVGHKKLAGILTELTVEGGRLDYVVTGLGLNVNWYPEEDEALLYPATSVLAETGRRVSRLELLSAILLKAEGYYLELLSGRADSLYDKWNSRSMVLHNWVEIDGAEERISGRALRIDRQGTLILLDERGEEVQVRCGDVSLRYGNFPSLD